MPIYRRSGGVWVAATMKRKVSGAFANATSVKRRSGGAWIECLASIAKSGDANGSAFEPEPAPQSVTVTSNTVTISGGGVTSVTWSYVSGATMTVNAGGLSAYFSGTVIKNGSRNAVYRATANNGLWIDVNVNLSYTTDL